MKSHLKQILELNLATIILGSSGVLGKLITISPPHIILIRSVIAFVFIWIILKAGNKATAPQILKTPRFFIISGALLAAHWVLYFIALEVTSVAVAFISVFTFPIFTTLLEPLFFKTRLQIIDLLLSLMVIIGIVVLVPSTSFSNHVTLGAFLGILSALFYALRNLMNKQYIHIYSGTFIMMQQMLIVSFLLIPSLLMYPLEPQKSDILWLFVLGIGTTGVGHTLFVRSLKHFKTSTASIITSLQPIYGIVLAIIFLGEKLNQQIMVGGGIIFITVLLKSFQEYLKEKRIMA
jgi:drug/metabolite transporter (DMT)-like permease